MWWRVSGVAPDRAQAWRLDGVGPHRASDPDVSVPRSRGPGPPGIRVHRCRDLVPADVEPLRSIPITTAARTLIDIALATIATHLRQLAA